MCVCVCVYACTRHLIRLNHLLMCGLVWFPENSGRNVANKRLFVCTLSLVHVFESFVFCSPKNNLQLQRRKHIAQTEHTCAVEVIPDQIRTSVQINDRYKPPHHISVWTYQIGSESSNQKTSQPPSAWSPFELQIIFQLIIFTLWTSSTGNWSSCAPVVVTLDQRH